jgi:membrane protease YdiL (CAAX protease family)
VKNIINWKTFWILLTACVITSVGVLPFQLAAVPELADLGTTLYIAAIVQSLVMFSIATFFGLILARKAGFELPILEGDNKLEKLKSILKPSVIWGLLSGVAIVASSFLFGEDSLYILEQATHVPIWRAVLATFYGGIAEEVLMRLFVVSLVTWILLKIKIPKNASIWSAIIFASILFGLGHLPITAAVTPITPIIVVRAIVLNGIGGMVFGWLYWKKGLESAMIAHFVATFIVNVIMPLVARMII